DIKIKGAKSLEGDLKVVSIYRERGHYYASLPFEITINHKNKTKSKTAVDVNVSHINYTDGMINTLPKQLSRRYQRIKHYQKMLSKKVKGSNNYVKTRTKLQREYAKVTNFQHDLIQKFITNLVNDFDKIVIEDLNVKQMKMSHVAS
ncbi:transposase, partial [Ligilactobacillus hayakitensis]|uniref:transposase n=1 Tax=Ligilactobacillus hayakitensis TaxID=396716 RepID=UPI000A6414F5